MRSFLPGRRENAQQTLQKLAKRFPDNPVVNASLIDLDLQGGKLEPALARAREVGTDDPVRGAVLEANVLARADRKDEAITVLDKALAGHPSSALARELFVARWQAGKQDEAVDGMRSWLSGHADDALGYTTLGDAYIQRGEQAKALALLDQAVQLLPNEPRILNNLAWLRDELDRPGAAAAARQAFALAQESPEIADTLGWILVRDGNVGEGLPLLREADQALNDNPEVRYHLAYAHERIRRPGRSAKAVARAFGQQARILRPYGCAAPVSQAAGVVRPSGEIPEG